MPTTLYPPDDRRPPAGEWDDDDDEGDLWADESDEPDADGRPALVTKDVAGFRKDVRFDALTRKGCRP